MSTSAFGATIERRFHVPKATTLLSGVYPGAPITFTRLTHDSPGRDWTEAVAPETALTLQVMARPMADYEVRVDGRDQAAPPLSPGDALLFDLQADPRVRFASGFDFVRCYLSTQALQSAARQAGVGALVGLRPDLLVLRDATVDRLVQCLATALERPEQANLLFVDHITLALVTHLVGRLGARVSGARANGRLAPWQERIAKEMIEANLSGDLSLAEVARSCGLSASHFSRAFARTTGAPPHQWLLRRRIARATALMQHPDLSLGDVARLCGFCDQSHFNRIFQRMMGQSPGAWRADRAGRAGILA